MIQLAIYAGIAIVLLGMVGTGVYKVKQWGATEKAAELQPKLDSCKADVKRQNDAVDTMRVESARKQAAATAELRKAEGRAKVWTDNATSLQKVLANRKPTDDKSCKAAWEAIRKPG